MQVNSSHPLNHCWWPKNYCWNIIISYLFLPMQSQHRDTINKIKMVDREKYFPEWGSTSPAIFRGRCFLAATALIAPCLCLLGNEASQHASVRCLHFPSTGVMAQLEPLMLSPRPPPAPMLHTHGHHCGSGPALYGQLWQWERGWDPSHNCRVYSNRHLSRPLAEPHEVTREFCRPGRGANSSAGRSKEIIL